DGVMPGLVLKHGRRSRALDDRIAVANDDGLGQMIGPGLEGHDSAAVNRLLYRVGIVSSSGRRIAGHGNHASTPTASAGSQGSTEQNQNGALHVIFPLQHGILSGFG